MRSSTRALSSRRAASEGELAIGKPLLPLFLLLLTPLLPLPSLFLSTRLLATWTAAAKRHGVPNRGVVAWVRRKLGPDVTVLRVRTDGSLGCATPCVLCRRALIAFDLRVSCPPGASGGGWYCGRLCSPDAPAPTLTSGQRRLLGHASPPKEGSRRSVARRRSKAKENGSNGGQGFGVSSRVQNLSLDHYTSNDGTSVRGGGGGDGDGSDFWRVNGGTGGRTGAAAAAAQNAARRRRRGVSVGDVSRGFVAVSGAAVSSAGRRGGGGDAYPTVRVGQRARGPAQPAARTWFEDSAGAEERNGGGASCSSSDGGGGGGSNRNNKNCNQGRGSRRGRRNKDKDLPLPQRGAPPPPPLPPLPPGRRSRVAVEKEGGGAAAPGTPPRRSELLLAASSAAAAAARFKRNDGRYSSSCSGSPSSSVRSSVSPSRRKS